MSVFCRDVYGDEVLKTSVKIDLGGIILDVGDDVLSQIERKINEIVRGNMRKSDGAL